MGLNAWIQSVQAIGWSWRSITLAFVVIVVAYRWWKRRAMIDTPAVQRRKRLEQLQRFAAAGIDSTSAEVNSVPTDAETRVLRLTAGELSSSIKRGDMSAHEAALIYARQSVRSQRAYNSLTEVMLKDGLDRAKALTPEESKTTSDQCLYGVPISLKDSIGVAGTDQTLGLANSVDRPSKTDALIVTALIKAGAIPIVKTNVPQTMLSFECSNPVFGRTVHPQNPAFTPGGSSGGEAVSVVTRGSCAGIGTDIGGSVRIPAHFTGCVALKPCGRRTSMIGFRPSVPGQEAVVGVPGPMSSCVDDCALLLQAIWTRDVFRADHDLVPIPFDRSTFEAYAGASAADAKSDRKSSSKSSTAKSGLGRPLRIGYYTHDGFVTPAPPCERALHETVKALQDAGHTLVPWQPPRVLDGMCLFYGLLSADLGKTISSMLVGEQLEPYVKFFFRNLSVPKPLRKLIARVMLAMGEVHASRIFGSAVGSSVTELWALHKARKEYRQLCFESFTKAQLDAVVCPAHALPAVRHGQYTDITFSCSYTALYNVLDWPAGVVPITHVNANTDADFTLPKTNPDRYPEGFVPGLFDRKVQTAYSAKMADGLPVGVQCVSTPFQDEVCLGVMKVIESTRKNKTRSDFIHTAIAPNAVAPKPGL